MLGRALFFEADRWYVTPYGWAAVLILDWSEDDLRAFEPEVIAVDYLRYLVTDVEVKWDGARWEVWVYTESELDSAPEVESTEPAAWPD